MGYLAQAPRHRSRYALGVNPSTAPINPAHQRRLREVWRSAGWPCQDLIEAELLAAGLLERVRHASGHETLRVTDAGVAALAVTLARNRARRAAREALAAGELSDASLVAAGAKPGAVRGLYALSHTNSAGEFAGK